MAQINEKVAFLGLGKMGFSMARHLSKSAVIVQILVVMLMLWDAHSVHDVLSGLQDADYKDRIFISHVTISPKESKALSEAVIGKGGKFLEAPVLGNSQVAEKGALQTLVGGDKELYERFVPMFKTWGTPRYLGAVGAATATKLSLNFLLGANLLSFATSYGYLEKKGVELDTFMTILTNGPFNLSGGYHPVWADKFKKRKYDPVAFASVGLDKDLELAKEEFESTGLHSSFANALSTAMHEAASKDDLGSMDMTAVYELINSKDK